MNDEEKLNFKISSGLKNIIGKDLISDKYIAIFELVKNSYDAGASKVVVSFLTSDDGSKIVISDNGHGMSKEDIINKWLFVAYSDKNPKNKQSISYLDEIDRVAAGAKGVGRFSCDRLGKKLKLITKTDKDDGAHVISLNWGDFEDGNTEFSEVDVNYSKKSGLPSGENHGTELTVCSLLDEWSRDDLLKLKRSLMRLINPDTDAGKLPFSIEIVAPNERDKDNTILDNSVAKNRNKVNGIVYNDVFEQLGIKTTGIFVSISEDGKIITTKLYDRGNYIFEIKERNSEFNLLQNITIKLYFMSRAAKNSFKEQMGINVKDYGNVFIYKNGFRVNPYGDFGVDIFGIDQRKAQGNRRFLGTREIIGRISITGENNGFVETTSRAHGFIRTKEVEMLEDFFIDKALKVLEKYVVNIIHWESPLKDTGYIIQPSEVRDAVIAEFLNPNVKKTLISATCNMEELLKKKTSTDSDSIQKIRNVAAKENNIELQKLVKRVSDETKKLKQQNKDLESDNKNKEEKIEQYSYEKKTRDEQLRYLKGSSNQTIENLMGCMHSIAVLSDSINTRLIDLHDDLYKSVSQKISLSIEMFHSALSAVLSTNLEIKKIAQLAIDGNPDVVNKTSQSLTYFIREYIRNMERRRKIIDTVIICDNKDYNCCFDSLSMGIIIDNIISNSVKARADKLEISLSESDKYVDMSFKDNGVGLNPNMSADSIFEWGYTSTKSQEGYGIGLPHIKQLVEEFDGNVYVDTGCRDGFCIIIQVPK